MSSGWTRPVCRDCWLTRWPDRPPVLIAEEWRELEACAVCGNPTYSGIYVRADPHGPVTWDQR